MLVLLLIWALLLSPVADRGRFRARFAPTAETGAAR
jgi:hypothetical protein